jgi:HJR/Mrr/RecB family endonuclease
MWSERKLKSSSERQRSRPISLARCAFYYLAGTSINESQIMGVKSKGFTVPTFTNGSNDPGKDRIYTEDEKKRMRAAILNASSLAEMAKLEKDFAEGRIPAYILEGPDAMET